MVTSGVVWCRKDDQWIPLQLSSIQLHGVLTQANWAAVSQFLQRVANKQFILQDNGFTELTEEQKEQILHHIKSRADNKELPVAAETKEGKESKAPDEERNDEEDEVEQEEGDAALDSCSNSPNSSVNSNNCNLFIDNLFKETDKDVNVVGRFTVEQNKEEECNTITSERKTSTQSDEIVLRLLRKYSKYSRDCIDDDILNELETSFSEAKKERPRFRKMSIVEKEERLYENCHDMPFFGQENFENQRNEHLLRWLKQQSNQKDFDSSHRKFSLPCRSSAADVDKSHSRKSSLSSAFESRKSSSSSMPGSRKSSVISSSGSRKSSVSSPSTSDSGFSRFDSRKNSVISNSSCSESEESLSLASHWQRILKKHLGSHKLEKKLKKQREAWARNTRRFSVGCDAAELATKS